MIAGPVLGGFYLGAYQVTGAVPVAPVEEPKRGGWPTAYPSEPEWPVPPPPWVHGRILSYVEAASELWGEVVNPAHGELATAVGVRGELTGVTVPAVRGRLAATVVRPHSKFDACEDGEELALVLFWALNA